MTRRALEDALDVELAARERGTVDITGVGVGGQARIGRATWRGELGKWDCRDDRYGIRAWAPTFERAQATVRKLVETKRERYVG